MSRKNPPLLPKDFRLHFTVPWSNYARSQRREMKLWTDEWESAAKQTYLGGRTGAKTLEDYATLNSVWLAQHNPRLTPDEIVVLQNRLDSLLKFGGHKDLVSAYVLNEYLAHETDSSFGDYLDRLWESLLEGLLQLNFSFHGLTDKIFTGNRLDGYLLSYNPKGTRAHREKLESLHQDDFKTLLKEDYRLLRSRPTVAADVIQAKLKLAKGGVEKSYSYHDVQNTFFRAFASAVAKTPVETDYRLDVLGAHVIQDTYAVRKISYKDSSRRKPGQVSTAEAMRLAEFLLAHHEELGVQRVAAIIFIFFDVSLIGRGHGEKLRLFLLSCLEDDDVLEILGGIVDLAVNYKGTLPTGTQWVKGLQNGELGFGSGDVIASMMGADTTELKQRSQQLALAAKLNPR